jgi:uncharacterized protein (TIGR02186 family)
MAKPIDADLDVRSVDIDHNFNGMDLLLYGARNDIGRIVIVLRGPEKRYLVRRKEKIAGIWVNRKSVAFDNVPGFYAAASTSAVADIRNDQLLAALNIGADHVPMAVRKDQKHLKSDITAQEFRTALVEHLHSTGLYRTDFSEVSFMGETLFRTWLEFPRNILGGRYTAEVFLFADGKLTAVQTIPIEVSKVGFEALVYGFAHRYPWVYGLLAVMMALGAGWAGNKVFRRG